MSWKLGEEVCNPLHTEETCFKKTISNYVRIPEHTDKRDKSENIWEHYWYKKTVFEWKTDIICHKNLDHTIVVFTEKCLLMFYKRLFSLTSATSTWTQKGISLSK